MTTLLDAAPKPYYERDGVTIYRGDCRDILPTLGPVDSVITDPPYELAFMGKAWDRSGVSFDPETWRLIPAKPGATLLSFGGTRTWHRIAVAIEDAGWELRDTLCWLYGSGFPKSLDVSKAIDKAAGAEREVVGVRPDKSRAANFGGSETQPTLESLPATDAARQWEGWGTALKPAWEPIVLCRKPLTGTVAANVQEWGTGALNIDGCRIGIEASDDIHAKNPHTEGGFGHAGAAIYRDSGGASTYDPKKGRWPANLLLECTCEETREGTAKGASSNSKTGVRAADYGKFGAQPLRAGYADPDGKETVRIHTDPNCPCYLLDAQSGELTSGARNSRAAHIKPESGWGTIQQGGSCEASSGGASRFFYCAKSSRAERNQYLDGDKNLHPTVKPLALMRYLCRLTKTPTGGIVLDPFMGSGTTLIAARLEGRPCIGIEKDERACEIAVKRLAQEVLAL